MKNDYDKITVWLTKNDFELLSELAHEYGTTRMEYACKLLETCLAAIRPNPHRKEES